MLRRALFVVPLTAAAAALIGVRLHARPLLAVVLAAALALAVAVVLGLVAEQRVNDLAARVRRFAQTQEAVSVTPFGSAGWRRLLSSLTTVGNELHERYASLDAERARVERLLEALPTAVLLFEQGVDAARVPALTYANPVARGMFGLARPEARTPLQVLGVAALADAVMEAYETGRSLDLQVERDDRQLVAHASATAEGVVALVVSDVTDAYRLEAVRRDFVTNASHELKTPVAGIQALADALVLALERDPERARTMIQRLGREASRLGQLVRDLLDLARLEEQGLDGEARRKVDLAAIVRGQVERLRPDAEQRRVTLVCDCAGPAPLVAQPTDLRLIAANLLENAVRYNRPGGRVRVSVRRDSAQVVLEVVDDGIGIPEADQDRVFERFYRVDKGRSRAAGGTGLGLSIVRHAAQRHGGEVTVSSVLGVGSTFRVVLPVEGANGGG